MSGVVNINDVLDGHVQLDVECLDRIYLNGYVPSLQVGGQVVRFLTAHLGNPIPSPAILERIGQRFRSAVDRFAERNQIPVVRFNKGERKIDRMRPFYARARRPGVVAIGIAQEFQWVATSYTRPKSTPGVGTPVRVRPGAAPGDVLLLLHPRSAVGAGVHQDLFVLPVSDQAVAQRPRMGQAASCPSGPRRRGVGQRVRFVCEPGPAAGDL